MAAKKKASKKAPTKRSPAKKRAAKKASYGPARKSSSASGSWGTSSPVSFVLAADIAKAAAVFRNAVSGMPRVEMAQANDAFKKAIRVLTESGTTPVLPRVTNPKKSN